MEQPSRLAHATEFLNALVRPLLAIAFGGAIVYMALVGLITSGEFLGMAAVVIGFFFQSRQAEKAEARAEAQNKEMVELAKAAPPVAESGTGAHTPPTTIGR